MNSDKHAYLIMAHKNALQLRKLISLLDNPKNDIFLHIDKKADISQFEGIKTNYSSLVMIPRIRVNWGGHSQIECELNLLKASGAGHYFYYHLISGADLPIKAQGEIHAFFRRNSQKNFFFCNRVNDQDESVLNRVKYYYVFQNAIGRNQGRLIRILELIEGFSLFLQKRIGIQRRQGVQLYKGGNWFSINDSLVQYILSREEEIKKNFYYSKCADELFLQSLTMASPFKESIVNNSLREIDWKRGNPYTYRKADVERLLLSQNLFARKFDEEVDIEAIDSIVDKLN